MPSCGMVFILVVSSTAAAGEVVGVVDLVDLRSVTSPALSCCNAYCTKCWVHSGTLSSGTYSAQNVWASSRKSPPAACVKAVVLSSDTCISSSNAGSSSSVAALGIVSEPVVRTLVVLVLIAKVDEVVGHGEKTQLSEGCDTTEPSGHILQSSLHFNTVLEVGASVLGVGGSVLVMGSSVIEAGSSVLEANDSAMTDGVDA